MDAAGHVGGTPIHAFIFLSWAGPGDTTIYDNQDVDYGNQYHACLTAQYNLNDDPEKVKDAIAFCMYR
ncbi:MAG: hypothetical protein VB070_09760 [Clostridiaceae bacterium]|nr:hypothetical protein [Clostridiaceae bacterium]